MGYKIYIDCDWVNGSVSMDTLEFMVVNAVNSLEIPTLRVQRVRNADEVKNISASFLILNGDCKLFSTVKFIKVIFLSPFNH